MRLTLLTLLGFLLLALCWHVINPGIAWDASGLHLTNAQDFLNYWAAPQLVEAGRIDLLFDGKAYERALHGLTPLPFQQLRWSYPLHSLFFYVPFASLPYTHALLLWSVLGLGLYAAIFWQALPPHRRAWFTAALLLSPVVLLNLATRQNGLFLGAAALGVLLLLHRNRPVAAGILLGCLTIKPQLFVLWPLYLLMTKQWRCIVAATLTTLALLVLSLEVHGFSAWTQYLAWAHSHQWQLLNAEEFTESRKLYHLMMPGITPALRLADAPDTLVFALQLLGSLTAFTLSLHYFRGPLTLAEQALTLSLGAFLLSPYGFNYDMTLLTAGLLLYAATHPPTRYQWLIGSVLYLLPLLIYILNLTLPVVPPLLALGLLALGDNRQRTRYITPKSSTT